MKHNKNNTIRDVYSLPKEARSDDMASMKGLLPASMRGPSREKMTRDVTHFGTNSTHHQIWLKPLTRERIVVTNTTGMSFSDNKIRSLRKKRSSHQKNQSKICLKIKSFVKSRIDGAKSGNTRSQC